MQWGEEKAGLDRVLDNNSGQIKACLQVFIIITIVIIIIIDVILTIVMLLMLFRTMMTAMAIFMLATDRVKA